MKHHSPPPVVAACIVGLLFAALATCTSGCRSNDGGFRVVGGSPEERAMVHGAFNNMVPFLQERGFDRVELPDGSYKLRVMETTQVWRLPDGGEQGVGPWTDPITKVSILLGGRGGEGFMLIFRPLHPWIANHEVIHSLLAAAGYIRESENHDRRAFDDGGHFPRGSRKVR